jgi:hypothetical protein
MEKKMGRREAEEGVGRDVGAEKMRRGEERGGGDKNLSGPRLLGRMRDIKDGDKKLSEPRLLG